ncbi:MAG: hypothetical protein ACRCTY_09115, partial [Candidatus Adiutrix sp.]
VLLTGAETFLKPGDNFFTSSKLWPYAQPVAAQARAWMPQSLRESLEHRTPNLLTGDLRTPPSPEATPTALNPTADITANIDWQKIQTIMRETPEQITPAWRDKLRSLSGPSPLSQEEMARFITDHPSLFAQQPIAPSWPQPASD